MAERRWDRAEVKGESLFQWVIIVGLWDLGKGLGIWICVEDLWKCGTEVKRGREGENLSFPFFASKERRESDFGRPGPKKRAKQTQTTPKK